LALAYNNRGLVRDELGDKQGAITDCEEAISIDPKSSDAYGCRGTVRSGLGDKQGAITDLQKAAALFKAQGEEKNYQAVLKNLQQINGR
jgi:tetratricopeptide (TPR) repeat protein